MRTKIAAAVVVVTVLFSVPVAGAASPVKYRNCAAMNRVYPHGVGWKKGLVNKGGKPVAYAVNEALYTRNQARDRDKDGIACEK